MAVRSILTTLNAEALSAGFLTERDVQRAKYDDVNDYFRFLYLVKGGGTFIDDFGIRHELIPGTLVQRFPHRSHTLIRKEGEWLEFFLALPRDLYRVLAENGAIQIDKWCLKAVPSKDIDLKLKAYVELLENSVNKNALAGAFAATLELFNMFYCLSEQGGKAGLAKSRIEKARSLLNSNFEKNSTHDEIASKIGIGTEHFRKEFKRIVGVSPKAYRIREKIKRAQDRLCGKTMSIAEISEELGYSDQFAFSRQFKKHTGLSPSQFRAQMDN